MRLPCLKFLPTIAVLSVALASFPQPLSFVGLASANAKPTGDVPSGMYRLTEEQFRNTIADAFGADMAIPGRFEPVERRNHGLLAPGSYQIAASAAGVEQFAAMAKAVANQVVDQKHRDTLVPCKPQASDQAAQDACLAQFFKTVGRYLYRRPLTNAEVQRQVRLADQSQKTAGDFYTGIALSLETMLVSPQFMFQIDVTEQDPVHPGRMKLSAASKAARLSFFLWDTSPDEQLLDAVERGDLDKPEGLAKRVDRLLASPRLEKGVRAFFTDMLALDQFGDVTKDPILYPQFTPEVHKDIPEETLRIILHLLVDEKLPYGELFTTRTTYISPALASVYGIQVDPNEKGWSAYDFPPDSPRAGIITQLTFLNAYSQPGRTSPTGRGKALRELILCQPVPDPPGNVEFGAFEESQAAMKTQRERLTAHRSNPVCAGCHKITDPIGLSLENFDTVGVYRTTEKGVAIDASTDLEGVTIKDAVGLGKWVSESPATSSCLVNRLVEYGTRQAPTDEKWIGQLKTNAAQNGYRLAQLLRAIATSEAFYKPQSL